MKRFTNIPVWFLLLIIIFALLKLWLVSDLSVVAIGAAGHDDRLYLNMAKTLVNGQWLGAYDVFTLAKGPFYPLWIAALFMAGFPLLMAQQVLYILATFLFVITVRPLFSRLLPLAALYIVVLFNPITYTVQCLRVVREGIYPALSILVLTGAIAIMLRVKDTRARHVLLSVATGFVLSAFWLTREEGVWMVPSLLVIMIWTAVKALKQRNYLRPLIACSLPWLVLILSLGLVASLNLYHYGVFNTVEFKARPFLDAYGSLCRVKPVEWIPDVPVPRETRTRLYRLSSAFAELEPFLDGESGRKWMIEPGNEINGGRFMWALRDAVAAAGYGKSGTGAMSFYRVMAEQINHACDAGRIDCFARRSSMMPPWRAEYNRPFLQNLIHGMWFLADFADFSADPSRSEGTESLLVLFRNLVHSPLSPLYNDIYEAGGWIFSENPSAEIQLIQEGQGGSVAELKRKASPDVERFFSLQGKTFPEAGKARFDIANFDASLTSILVLDQGQTLASIPLDGSIDALIENGVYFHLDYHKIKGYFFEQERSG